MKKIEIKLKECCLTCEHFDPSGCVGLSPSVFCCGEPDRVIACGHMAVCKKYNGDKTESSSGWIVIDRTPHYDVDDPSYSELATLRRIEYKCTKCGQEAQEKTKFCPNCGTMNIKDET